MYDYPKSATPTYTARWAISRSATPTARRETCPSAAARLHPRRFRSHPSSTRSHHLVSLFPPPPGSTTLSTTAYGIWQNGATSYTICGGYDQHAGRGTLSDTATWSITTRPPGDSRTGRRSNTPQWDRQDFVTHFEGISGVETELTRSLPPRRTGSTNLLQGSLVTVRRNTDGTFGDSTWVNLNQDVYPNDRGLSSANSVYGNQVIGIVPRWPALHSFQATLQHRLPALERHQRQRRQRHRDLRVQRQPDRHEQHRHRCQRHGGDGNAKNGILSRAKCRGEPDRGPGDGRQRPDGRSVRPRRRRAT